MATAIEAAERGASLLDGQRPGWHRAIDIAQLNIAHAGHCICGQLYGGYIEGLTALGVGSGPREYGFNAHGQEAYDELTAAWRDEIARRRLAEVPVTAALAA